MRTGRLQYHVFLCILTVLTAKHYFRAGRFIMEENNSRIGIIGIVINDIGCTAAINEILHGYSPLIIGRMGIPYREKNVSVISLIVDGNNDDISALTGKLGRIAGATVKSMITKK